jgi:RNA polymerase sigma-70 factor (ECF subfamily)
MELKTNHETNLTLDPVRRRPIYDDSEVLEELFSRYRGRLYNTALQLVGNPDDAEDALQDGLFAAFRKLSTFEGRSQFSTWLTRIVFNAAVMQLRRRPPEAGTSIDEPFGPDQQPLAHRIPDPGPNPEEIYEQQERLQIVARCFRSLPAPYRQAVWLCHVQGLKIREAAEALGLPRGTLKTQLHRARLRFRKELVTDHRRRKRAFGRPRKENI